MRKTKLTERNQGTNGNDVPEAPSRLSRFELISHGISGWRGVFALFLLSLLTTIASPAQKITVLARFDVTNGENPVGPLVQGLDGSLYGATVSGGVNGGGSIFKVTTKGVLTSLYSFCQTSSCTDGTGPGALVQALDGNFYGTTDLGGVNGRGTVFKVTPGGTLTTLYSFCSQANCADGSSPSAGFLLASDGNFYGTTNGGGAIGDGTVFRITRSGTLTTLHNFCSQNNCADGFDPSGLIQATDGRLYGETQNGGAYSSGSVFKITLQGAFVTLYSFCPQLSCRDGVNPSGGLVQATDGNFYGTALRGGANSGGGTVFRITPRGVLTTLYAFCSQSSSCQDGSQPYARLVQGTDGNFYGTTLGGGTYGRGTYFTINAGGTLTTLDSFSSIGAADTFFQATDGNFYGPKAGGGTTATNAGVIYKLNMGLGPFVEMLPAFGNVGARVIILGTNLTGATAVSFNGTGATFTVVSASEINTTVPTGATTGTVEVTTPGGTLNSNIAFRVP